jgi:hypothetical protein
VRLCVLVLSVVLVCTACVPSVVTTRYQPTSYYLVRERNRTKTHVEILLEISPDQVVDIVRKTSSKCLLPVTAMSSDMSFGPGVTIHTTLRFEWSVDEVSMEGRRWMALRMDGEHHHTLPMAFEVSDHGAAGSRVVVYRADASQKERIRELLVSGELLCRYREVSFPSD